MTWVRLDEEFPDHPKVAAAGPLASWLHVCALAYCNRYLTDGFVPVGQVPKLADFSEFPRIKPIDLATRLVLASMWEREPGGFRIHDFEKYQPTKAQIEAERAAKSSAGRKGAESKWGRQTKAPPMAGAITGAMAPPTTDAMAPPMAGVVADGWPVSVSGSVSPSRLSVVHPGGAGSNGGEGKPQVKPTLAGFVNRIVAMLGERHRGEAEALVDRWRGILAEHLIDQAIGMCEQAEKRPRTIAYFEKTLRETAAIHGVEVASA